MVATDAQLAGELGLPFGASYHVSPATVLEAVEAYRNAFRPSATLAAPYVLVSADVVVAPDDDTARELASGYGLWVLSIRNGQGAIDFPTPAEAAAHEWSENERDLVADRIATQFVGSPHTVADQLQVLARRDRCRRAPRDDDHARSRRPRAFLRAVGAGVVVAIVTTCTRRYRATASG